MFRTKATFCEAKLETEWKYTGFIARAANVKLRRFEVRKRFAPAKPETKRRHTRVRAKQAATIVERHLIRLKNSIDIRTAFKFTQ